MFYVRFKWEAVDRKRKWYWAVSGSTKSAGSSYLADAFPFTLEELKEYSRKIHKLHRPDERILLEIFHSSFLWPQYMMIGQIVRCVT